MKEKALFVVILAFILLSAPVLGAGGAWPEKRHDGGNTSAVEGVGDMKDGDLVEKWRFGPVNEGLASFNWNFVADINGDGRNEVVCSAENRIVALDGENGNVVWNYTDSSFYEGNSSVYPPVLSLVKIKDKWNTLEGSDDPNMMLSYGEKKPVWALDFYNDPDSEYYGFHWVGIVYSGGNAYGLLERPDIYSGYPSFKPPSWQVGNSSIILFDLSDSKPVWKKDVPLFAVSAGIGDIDGDSSDDIILSGLGKGAEYGVLMALDIHGNEEWNVTGNFSGDRFLVGDITGDGNPEIILGNESGYSCFSNDGDLLWNITFQWEGQSPLVSDNTAMAALYDGKGIVMGDIGKYLYFIGGDGKILWKTGLSGHRFMYPVIADIDGDGTKDILLELFNGSESGHRLVCLDSNDGSEKWSYHLNGDTPESALVVADVDSDGKLEILVSEMSGDDIYVVCLDNSESAPTQQTEDTPLPAYLIGIALISVALISYTKKRRNGNP